MTDSALSGATIGRGLTEDGLAVFIGFLIFVLALAGLSGTDALGWAVTTSVWTDASKALAPASKAYAALGGVGALAATYAFLLIVLSAGVAALKGDVQRFAVRFTAVFWIAYLSWIIGSYAHFAAVTPADHAEIRDRLVAAPDQRRRLHRRAHSRPYHRQFLSPLRRLAERGDPPRALYQDRHRHPRRVFGRHAGHS